MAARQVFYITEFSRRDRRSARARKGKYTMNFTIIPRSWTPILHSVLRIVTGLVLLDHGTGKILGFPDLSAMKPMLGALFYVTGGIELVGGVLILVGFLDPPGRLYPRRIHRGGLFHGAFSAGIFPGPERRRRGHPVLLHLSLSRRRRRRPMGGRQRISRPGKAALFQLRPKAFRKPASAIRSRRLFLISWDETPVASIAKFASRLCRQVLAKAAALAAGSEMLGLRDSRGFTASLAGGLNSTYRADWRAGSPHC